MTLAKLFEEIKRKKSFLCVGLDVDLDRLPESLKKNKDPIFDFCKSIIDATAPYCVAYKPNIAFFEAYGIKGWQALEKIIKYLNKNYPEQFTIADAKRADIGNTAKRYAKTYFEYFNFDSITVAPYMGRDSVEPFMEYEEKYTILLALTSNKGASDFQLNSNGSKLLYEQVIEASKHWNNSEELMYVVGATKANALSEIRKSIPDNFLLVPGVGAQGGSLEKVAKHGMNDQCGLLVNSSRGILYASSEENFAESATEIAKELQKEMSILLSEKGLI
jgi:orotidine-5'-phosphate decarboxylase